MDTGNNFFSWLIHAVSGSSLIAALSGIFPFIGGAVAIVYYSFAIYEMQTLKDWRAQRRRRKIAKLKLLLEELEDHHERHLHRQAPPPSSEAD